MQPSCPLLFLSLLHSPTTHPTPRATHLQGAIPKISDLPAPWGDKPYSAPPAEELTSSGYLPASFPEGWSPLKDGEVA